MSATVLRFGAFELDPVNRRLFCGQTRIRLPEAQMGILLALATSARGVVPKQDLVDAAWGRVSVSDNSLKQNVSRLRATLRQADPRAAYIETIPSTGYRLTMPVMRTERHLADPPRDARRAAHQAFTQAIRSLYTLELDGIRRARAGFEEAIRHDPEFVDAYVGLTHACALIYEGTRVDTSCDVDALRTAIHYGRMATTMAPASAEASSSLAFALHLNGDIEEAAGAAALATRLEPDDWRHWLRLGFVSWGEDRIRAARKVLALCADPALAHWLIATALVARGAFPAALDVLAQGCRDQDTQATEKGSFSAVGLHLLRGLVLAALGRLDEAVNEFQRELSSLNGGHLYARECAANTWYALGAILRRQGCREEAQQAFAHALDAGPGHLYSAAALGRPHPATPPGDPRALDAAFAHAAGLSTAGRHADAAHAYRHAVTTAAWPSAGWILPVEPLIDPSSQPEIWAETLAIVRRRAV